VPPPVPILSQLDPVHTPTSYFLKIHLNIIFHLRLVLPIRSLPQISPPKPCIRLSSPPTLATCLANLILLDLFTRKIFGDQCGSLSSSVCSFLHSPVTSSLLGPNSLNTLFSDTLSLRSSLNMSDQVSHPYITTRKIIIVYILIFLFLDSKLEDKRFVFFYY